MRNENENRLAFKVCNRINVLKKQIKIEKNYNKRKKTEKQNKKSKKGLTGRGKMW